MNGFSEGGFIFSGKGGESFLGERVKCLGERHLLSLVGRDEV